MTWTPVNLITVIEIPFIPYSAWEKILVYKQDAFFVEMIRSSIQAFLRSVAFLIKLKISYTLTITGIYTTLRFYFNSKAM